MNRPRLSFVLATLFAAGCGPKLSRAPNPPVEFEFKSAERLSALGSAADAQSQSAAPRRPASAEPAPSPGPRPISALKLIRTASLRIEVQNFRAAVDEASRSAAAFGGYLSDRQSSEDGLGRERGQITLRIPFEAFDGAVSALKRLGRVKTEAIQTQDVTKSYADLETRLKVKRETAVRLREILTRQTGKVSEVLEVEREIARVVEETEQAEGERRYFDNLVSLSTITLSLHEPESMVTPGNLDPVFAALRRSLRTMSDSLASLIELTAGLLPWVVALYLAFRALRWRFGRRSQTPPAAR
jgi:hypothetical protein